MGSNGAHTDAKTQRRSPVWELLIEDARLYPSPHNSQPIKVRPISDTEAELYYDKHLGLPAESFGIPFGQVCAGVFLECFRVTANAQGFAVEESLDFAELDFTAPGRMHSLGKIHITPHKPTPDERAALQRMRTRRTSRRPYLDRRVPDDVIRSVQNIAAESGYRLKHTGDPEHVRQIVRINQETLFADLENDDVHAEILAWLRYSHDEAKQTGDGLSAETMFLPGRLLKFCMQHRRMWTLPVIGNLVRKIYLNTMRGVHEMAWLEGKFEKPQDFIEAGRTFMRVWLELHRHGVVIHPFGTVITNPKSHQQFSKLVDAHEQDGNFAWMLFRLGYSKYPPQAFRRPGEAMVISEVS